MRADSGTRAVKCLGGQGRRPARDPSSDLHRYWLTTFVSAEALVVCSVPWRCPRLGAPRKTIETIGTLRNLERERRLAITETTGRVTIGVADPNPPAPTSK
jgi:hypothetical protein